jgi:pilus assembly protein CpaE
MMPLNAAFIISSRAVWEQAHACIQNLPVRLAIEQGTRQEKPSEADELLDRIERHRVDVVLIEASLIAIPLEEFVRRLRNTTSQPAVFVLNPDASPQLILEALRAGANEYLYPPLSETLRDALQRLSDARSKGSSDPSKSLGKVFGFLSAQGGCGATTFAAHVAPEIARQSKQQTLLADLDFEAGILRFLMKSKNTYSVRDALENLHRLDSSLWKALVSSLPDKLDVIPASDELAAKKAPGGDEMAHLLRFMRSAYPISIVDFGRSISSAAMASLPELEMLYVITLPDTGSVGHTRKTMATLEQRGFPGNRIGVLLNRAGDKKAGPDAVQKTLGRPLDGVFRDEHLALYDAYSEGRFLPASNALGKEFRGLAERIRKRASGEPASETAERPAEAAEKAAENKSRFSLKGLSFLQKVPGFQRDQVQRAEA